MFRFSNWVSLPKSSQTSLESQQYARTVNYFHSKNLPLEAIFPSRILQANLDYICFKIVPGSVGPLRLFK